MTGAVEGRNQRCSLKETWVMSIGIMNANQTILRWRQASAMVDDENRRQSQIQLQGPQGHGTMKASAEKHKRKVVVPSRRPLG